MLGLPSRAVHFKRYGPHKIKIIGGTVWVELTDAEYAMIILKYDIQGTPTNTLQASVRLNYNQTHTISFIFV